MPGASKKIGKPCFHCGVILTADNFVVGMANNRCKPCHVKINREWREKNPVKCNETRRRDYLKHRPKYIERAKKFAQENPEKRKKYNSDYRWRIKMEMIEAYGGSCVCCGEAEPAFLTIDHINNDGAESRRSGQQTGGVLYASLKRAGWPKDEYQLMCMNCNLAKGLFGECPHKFACVVV